MTRLSALALLRNTNLDAGVGLRARLQAANAPGLRAWLESQRDQSEIFWLGHDSTPLITNGPPSDKINMVVIGDGFAADDQDDYDLLVHELLTEPVDGLFAQDFFAANRTAFNVLRLNLVSAASGASTKTFNSDGELESEVTRDTALGVYYTGEWNRCWVEDGPDTARRLEQALSVWAPEHSIVWVLLNHPGGGGCGGSGRMTTGAGVGWGTVAHELGHALANLADEYCDEGTWPGGEPDRVNITANTDRASLKWGHLVKSTTPIPTGLNDPADTGCSRFTEGDEPDDWDPVRDVGLFEGATLGQQQYSQNLYRPSIRCRMQSGTRDFCPVCEQAMQGLVDPHLRRADDERQVGSRDDGYLRMVVRSDRGSLRVVSARRLSGACPRPATVAYGLAHEVRLGDRRIALGTMPDVATSRSMEDPAVIQGHHGHELETYDFVVRVPVAQLRGADLATLTIDVVDVRASAHQPLRSGLLRDEPGLSVRPVSSVRLHAQAGLPAALQSAIAEQ